jgi:hypothetical protein
MNLKGIEELLNEIVISCDYEKDFAYLIGYKHYLTNTRTNWDISTRSFYEKGWTDAEGDHES